MKISMCSVNICGLNSTLKYNILQDYMIQFYAISTETNCDLISNNEINGFNSFIMPPPQKTHKHGGYSWHLRVYKRTHST